MAAMTARMRRIASDWEQVRKDFAGHKNIIVTPVGGEPPEKYHITYFVNGIYLLPDGKIETLGRHEVEITLHAEYPRYKPICKILTPIWHPNFRDGQICIGDIWGAGESLSDIIINIGDMIQYKSWNSYSPLSAEAAKWAIENKHLFPVGNTNLHIADYASAKDEVNIDLFDEDGALIPDSAPAPTEHQADDAAPDAVADATPDAVADATPDAVADATPDAVADATPDAAGTAAAVNAAEPDGNDFDITAEELAGIEFVPTAQRMQSVSHGGMVKGKRINFKTILVKGLLWALIGAIIGVGIPELTGFNRVEGDQIAARLAGHPELVDYYEYYDEATTVYKDIDERYRAYCEENNLDPEDNANLKTWMYDLSSDDEDIVQKYIDLSDKYDDVLFKAYRAFSGAKDEFVDMLAGISRVRTGLWSAIIALFIGLFLGIGEGVYYGSKGKAVKYALLGAGISIVMGFLSGYLAQLMYANMLTDDATDLTAALVRGLGWALMGLGIGGAIGFIKPAKKRILFCALGGLVGAFIGGFIFDYITKSISDDVVARCAGVIIMGILIGVGVGLLEQFAKQAWLKVIRGEFEGKEYLVFAGTTSIGNNGKNTIVLFKDKLVAPHHCDIVLEGSKYVVVDQGSPLGTVVNGSRTNRHVLKKGDAIAIGNSVLIFNTK